ncbi:MAG: flagella basal body P-ring formation protein FlgA [Polaromonas sp. 39-63-203]|uniref:flagellar basal body P-ring formation chaperone FlgA n=1 Tax=Polaromonas sp. TaxID=1869339 RepID=UPI000BCDF35B|nr:flagellar basal body P-ring formation chaperone FlgA [Polaromonas sp.]OYY53591.1 MAG: flagella basal body P-ring formation protein FlgA [Polaromonas sp. 35-63-240]OYZ03254.1 MAG: flagella basal body P-ring formation protein FlgA [Polaromonas sp. 28-63-22]OYZ85022.1 MAG: flagella basal body P-ring formation protein FlgA [Polaromonas sp. 24-62-144]OZB02358.1 MAG: flagella basal body P-ring formation protein FlgA [Polaromonas sp. 39-63-203]HQS32636.1 flagellar basal body P-ring formation chape
MPLHSTLLSSIGLALYCLLASMAMPARGATPLSGSAGPVIEHFLLAQTAGLPGKVSITIDKPRFAALPPCEAPEAFLPSGVRPWGRVSVGVRCNESPPWTRYVAARVGVVAGYYVAARTITAGQALTPVDVAVREGDLATLPASVVVDPAQLGGVVALNRIASGAPIRRELLRGVVLVRQGQSIKLVTRGAGFVASAEGKAMTDAAAGAVVQVKMQGGQLLSGVVQPDGSVERDN